MQLPVALALEPPPNSPVLPLLWPVRVTQAPLLWPMPRLLRQVQQDLLQALRGTSTVTLPVMSGRMNDQRALVNVKNDVSATT